MSDLISRQALLKLFENLRDENETNCISYNALYKVLLIQPTINIAEQEIRNKAIDEFADKLISLYPRNYAGELHCGGLACYFDVVQIKKVAEQLKEGGE